MIFLLIVVALIALTSLKRGNSLAREFKKLKEEVKTKMSTQEQALTGVELEVGTLQTELVAHTTAISQIEQALAAEILASTTNNTPLDPARITAIRDSLVAVVGALQAQDSAIAAAVAAVPAAPVATPAPVVTPAPVDTTPAPVATDPTPAPVAAS